MKLQDFLLLRSEMLLRSDKHELSVEIWLRFKRTSSQRYCSRRLEVWARDYKDICMYICMYTYSSLSWYALIRIILHLVYTLISLCRLSWIEVNGTTYKKNSVVVLGMDLVPRFGVVEEVHTDMYYLVCEVLVTECLSHHFHSFQTCKQHPVEYVICKPANLYDHTVLAAYVIPTQRHLFHIPLKYQLIDDLLYM